MSFSLSGHRRQQVIRIALLPSLMCGSACTVSPDEPSLRILASEHTYEAPRQVRAGLVQVRLVNNGADVHEALLVHFPGSTGSAASYVDSARAGIDFPAFAIDVGGAGLTLPGDSTVVWLDLAPGRYALVCWKGDHLRRGMARDIDAIGPMAPSRSRPPGATLSLRLIDHSYLLEGPLRSGRQVIRIENRGRQPHEADIFRLEPGITPRDYISWLESGEQGEPPVTPVGGVGSLVPGRGLWLAVTLRPGRYFIICQVPDLMDGLPHHKRGMVREFEVL